MQKKVIQVNLSLIDKLSDLRTKLYGDIVLQKQIFDMIKILDKAENELKEGRKMVSELESAAKVIGDDKILKIASNYDGIIKMIQKQIDDKRSAVAKIPDL